MPRAERLFLEFVDAILKARTDDELELGATRLAHGLGFRWFAYLRLADGAPKLSSYPISWTARYFRRKYQRLDPVLRRARIERNPFSWGAGGSIRPSGAKQSRILWSVLTFENFMSGDQFEFAGRNFQRYSCIFLVKTQ